MLVVFLILLSLLISVTPALAGSSFDPKYKRDYNIFHTVAPVLGKNSLVKGRYQGEL